MTVLCTKSYHIVICIDSDLCCYLFIHSFLGGNRPRPMSSNSDGDDSSSSSMSPSSDRKPNSKPARSNAPTKTQQQQQRRRGVGGKPGSGDEGDGRGARISLKLGGNNRGGRGMETTQRRSSLRRRKDRSASGQAAREQAKIERKTVKWNPTEYVIACMRV